MQSVTTTDIIMKFELFIAKRLQLYNNDSSTGSAAFSLKIATSGIILAIIIMIASIAIVSGFKSTIINKMSALEPHIKLESGEYRASDGNTDSINCTPSLLSIIRNHTKDISSASLVAESPCIIKTRDNFNGIMLKGVSPDYDGKFLSNSIISGKYDVTDNNIIISSLIAKRMNLSTGDRIQVFFITDGKIKQRKLNIAGIFNTDFEDFDKAFIIGDIKIAQSVNSWDANTGTSIDIFCNDIKEIDRIREEIAHELYESLYMQNSTKVYELSTITERNSTYFAWLDLLDTNIVVILILMTLVACFSLIAGLLIVVLNRINMIGILKSLGANNKNIRTIFIYLAEKIILRAIVIGNATGLLLIFIQQQFHIIKLDPNTYYMSYVPVEFNIWLIVLNIGILIVSLLALVGPSYIITSINPAKTIRFE